MTLRAVEPIEWTDAGVVVLDQLRLPGEVVHHTYTDYRDMAKAITDLVIRGAPAIGVAASMGIALGVLHSRAKSLAELRVEFATICDAFSRTRPTAVDLFWAIGRFKRCFAELADAAEKSGVSNFERIRAGVVEEAKSVHRERKDGDERIGRFGAELLPKTGRVMTQCNAGALATGEPGPDPRRPARSTRSLRTPRRSQRGDRDPRIPDRTHRASVRGQRG
jgi:methylthioribose-1-phosphate isomerase